MVTEPNQRLSRWITAFYKVVNPVFRFLVIRFSFQSHRAQDALHILRVQGRSSGKVYEVPIRIAAFEHKRYIISLLGDSQWSRNLRSAGAAELVAGKTIEPIHAIEIQNQEKAAFLRWYCQQPAFAGRIQVAAPEDIDRISPNYPVFRLESAIDPMKSKGV